MGLKGSSTPSWVMAELGHSIRQTRPLDYQMRREHNSARLGNPMHWKFWAPFLAAVSAIVVAVIASYAGGFFGILIAGLLITFAAVQYDLDKSDVGGGFPSASLYARQVAAREQMTPDERNAYRAELHALWRPLVIGKTIGIGLILLGLGGYLFL